LHLQRTCGKSSFSAQSALIWDNARFFQSRNLY